MPRAVQAVDGFPVGFAYRGAHTICTAKTALQMGTWVHDCSISDCSVLLWNRSKPVTLHCSRCVLLCWAAPRCHGTWSNSLSADNVQEGPQRCASKTSKNEKEKGTPVSVKVALQG